jgi:hypothetical protein
MKKSLLHLVQRALASPKTTVAGLAVIAASFSPAHAAAISTVAGAVGLILSADARTSDFQHDDSATPRTTPPPAP